jgi:hypothetical protein
MRWPGLIKSLVAGYFVVGLAGLIVGVLLRDQPQLVNSGVWIRNGFVLLSAALMYLFVLRAQQGNRRALIRVRVLSVIIPLIVVVLVVLPDGFPVWMKVQQVLAGLSVAGVAVLVNWRPARVSRSADGVAR